MKMKRLRRVLAFVMAVLLILGIFPYESYSGYPAGTVMAEEGNVIDGESAEAPAEEAMEIPAETPAETPAEEVVEIPAETPVETPAEETVETPAETLAEEAGEIPAETSAETPAEEAGEIPAEILTEDSVEVTGETEAGEWEEITADVPIEGVIDEYAESEDAETSESDTEETETETETETESETAEEEMMEPSDGSLEGMEVYFKDMTEAVSILYALFDGGEEEVREVEFLLNDEGYFTGKIPEGDYSRITFRYENPDGERITIRPFWHYYGGETALKNTEVVRLEPDKKYVYCYMTEPEYEWDAETETYYVEGIESYWDLLLEEEEDRVIEPSTGEWGGETMHFVNLFWEDVDLGDVYAVFQGGTGEDQEILMSRGGRGKYSAVIPEGDYSRVSFCRLPEKGTDETAEETAQNPAKNQYEIYDTPFQYYGEKSEAEGCVPVFYMPGAGNTFYYDTERPGRSYWSADALYEGPVGGAMMLALPEGAADQAGNILYFADLSPDDKVHVKRVTMQFFDAADAADKIETVMYEGREGIFSAPIPQGGREEVTFRMEFDDGTSYQIVRRFNIYTEGSTNADEYFLYSVGEMDTFFFNNVQNQVGYNEMADSYWGPHPSVTNRGIGAQYFYVDTTDRNKNGVFVDPATLTIDYGNGPVEITQYTRDPNIYYFQFPTDCSAREQTILTLKGRLGYTETYAGEKTYDEITFRFCYPYNSDKKMIAADNLREFKPVFEELVFSDTDKLYVLYDNSTTGFASIQYRLGADDETGTVTWTNEWAEFVKTTPEDWENKPNAAVVENLWGIELDSRYRYIQFRGKTEDGSSAYWFSTMDTGEQSPSRIPSEKYSYPCFFGMKANSAGSSDEEFNQNVTMNGVWMSALDVRDLGDSTMNIPNGTFQKERSTYYGVSTFYDYYTDFELRGIPLSQNKNQLNMTANTLNVAVSEYYKGTGVNPLYMDRQNNDGSLGLYNYNQKLNTWTGKNGPAITGAVDGALSASNALTKGGVEIPLFNESFLRGNNSAGANLGQIYSNVYFPFTKNSAGYWEFDSSREEQTLRMKYDVNNGYFLERTGEAIIPKDQWSPPDENYGVSFFPFNDKEDQIMQDGDQSTMDHLNYLFSTRFEIPFTLPEGNEIVMQEGADAVPVTFEFRGDDDTWIFVDGRLVLDIGGIHDAITGRIDFKTGTATVTTAGGGSTQSSFILDHTIKTHTLTMFYMERGRYASNLKITFNFPKQHTLNVTNEIDTSAANPIFSSALANIGSFAYKIRNRATSGEALAVEDSAGYVSMGEPAVFSNLDSLDDVTCNGQYTSASPGAGGTLGNGTPSGGSLVIEQKDPLSTANTDAQIIDRLVSVAGSKDISGYAYLKFIAYNDSDYLDSAGESLFVSLRDGSGNRIGGWASRLAYAGSTNSINKQEWSIIRVDINRLRYMNGAASFDRTNVAAVEFATRHTTPVRIDNLEFYQSTTALPSHGFSVDRDQISDYGSLETGKLEEATGAWYGYYAGGLSRSIYRMVENGFFSIGDGERAEFVDKFRAGSYMQVEQRDIDQRVFSTTWSIYENGSAIPENALLGSRTDIQKVKNSGGYSSLENHSGVTPDDGRTAYNSGTPVERPDGNSFVYRSYEDPDNDEVNPINLTVAYRNVLKTGSITIRKELELEEGQSGAGPYISLTSALPTWRVWGLQMPRSQPP